MWVRLLQEDQIFAILPLHLIGVIFTIRIGGHQVKLEKLYHCAMDSPEVNESLFAHKQTQTIENDYGIRQWEQYSQFFEQSS